MINSAKQSISPEAIHLTKWIASSRSLSSGAHSRDPLAPRNDEGEAFSFPLSNNAFISMDCRVKPGNDEA
jgi:hypothetical protein